MKTITLTDKYMACKDARIDVLAYPRLKGEPLQIALQAVDSSEGYDEPVITFTTNLGAYGEFPKEGNVFIKVTPDAEGAYLALFEAGYVGPVLRTLSAGMVAKYAVECKILEPELLEVS